MNQGVKMEKMEKTEKTEKTDKVPISIVFKYPVLYEGLIRYPTFWVLEISDFYDLEVIPVANIINPEIIWLRGPLRLSSWFEFFRLICTPEQKEDLFPDKDFENYFFINTRSMSAKLIPLSEFVIESLFGYKFKLKQGQPYSVVSPIKITKSEEMITFDDLSCLVAQNEECIFKGVESLTRNGGQTPTNLFKYINHKFVFLKMIKIDETNKDHVKNIIKTKLPDCVVPISHYLASKESKKQSKIIESMIDEKLDKKSVKNGPVIKEKFYDGPHPDNFALDSLDNQGKIIGDYCNWKRSFPDKKQDDPEICGALYWQRYGRGCNVRVFCIFKHVSGRYWNTWAFYRDLLILNQDPVSIRIMKKINFEIKTDDYMSLELDILNQIDLCISNELHLPSSNCLQGLETTSNHAQELIQQFYEIKYKLHLMMPVHSFFKPFSPVEYYPLSIQLAQQIPFISLPMFEPVVF